MNKKLWVNYAAEMPCPNCQEGVLQYTKIDIVTETRESLIDNEYHRNGIIFPYTTSLGTSHLKCSKCTDVVIMTYIQVDDVRHQDEEGNELLDITPLSYYPPPKIIHIPASCPKNIQAIFNSSFGLFWIDLASCANKIRIGVEALMDHYQIDNTVKLHQRIQKFARIDAKVSNYLLAIKWIGNSGSHYDEITKNAILDAYELLEYSLELLFNDREEHLNKLSDKINTARKHQ
jgi:hypothetical protein